MPKLLVTLKSWPSRLNRVGDRLSELRTVAEIGVGVLGLIERAARRIRRRRAGPPCRSTYQAAIRSATVFKSSSPALWPRLSLMNLKLSRSMNSHRHPAAVTLRMQQRMRQTIVEQGAVGKPGQRIVVGHKVDAIFGQFALDRDAGDTRGNVDEPLLGHGRFAHDRRIHREDAEHCALMREDRSRPARTKPMLGGQTLEILPQRIGHDVGDDDGFPPIGGRAARPALGPMGTPSIAWT